MSHMLEDFILSSFSKVHFLPLKPKVYNEWRFCSYKPKAADQPLFITCSALLPKDGHVDFTQLNKQAIMIVKYE